MNYKLIKIALIFYLLMFVGGCGNGDGEDDPPQITITGLSVIPDSASIPIGLSQSLTATATYSDGSNANVSSSVTWQSSNIGIATVSDVGLVTSQSQGAVTITATLDGQSSFATMSIIPPVISSVVITPLNSSIALGRSIQILATGIYSDTSNADVTSSVNWGSSNEAVATIDTNGLLSSHSEGSITVTASLGGEDATAMVVVTAKVLDSLTVNPNNPTIQLGTEQQFSATGEYSDLSTADITTGVNWSSNQTAVATIINNPGAKGLATGKIVGSALIQAEHSATGIIGQSTLSFTTPIVNRAYVAVSSGNVIVIDTSTDTVVDTVDIGNSAYSVAVDTVQNKAFITNNLEDTVTVFDIASNQVITTIGVGDNPQAVAVNPARSKAYVLNPSDFNSNGTVTIINTITNNVITTVTVGRFPSSVTIADSGNASGVFIANTANVGSNGVPGSLTVLDVATDSITHASITGVGDCPRGVAYQPSTVRVRVLSYCAGTGYISAVHATTKAVSDPPVILGVSGTATDLAVDPAVGGRIYVAHPSVDSVSVTEYVFKSLEADIPVGNFPTKLAFDSAHNKVYVSNCSDGTVSVIDAATNLVTSTINVGGCPRGIAIIN